MSRRKADFVATNDCRVGLDKDWILLKRPNGEVEDSLYRPRISGWDYSTHLAFAEYVRSFPSAVEYMQADPISLDAETALRFVEELDFDVLRARRQ